MTNDVDTISSDIKQRNGTVITSDYHDYWILIM
jgi:hypothetical protein